MKNKGYADFWGGANKVYYGECGNGELKENSQKTFLALQASKRVFNRLKLHI